MLVTQADCALESVDDEYGGDESGEAVLGEARDVLDEKAEIKRDQNEKKECRPEADPKSKFHEIHIVTTKKESDVTNVFLNYIFNNFFSSSNIVYIHAQVAYDRF